MRTLEEFKWLMLGTTANEASFWMAHSAENAEKIALFFNDLADLCFSKMKGVENG